MTDGARGLRAAATAFSQTALDLEAKSATATEESAPAISRASTPAFSAFSGQSMSDVTAKLELARDSHSRTVTNHLGTGRDALLVTCAIAMFALVVARSSAVSVRAAANGSSRRPLSSRPTSLRSRTASRWRGQRRMPTPSAASRSRNRSAISVCRCCSPIRAGPLQRGAGKRRPRRRRRRSRRVWRDVARRLPGCLARLHACLRRQPRHQRVPTSPEPTDGRMLGSMRSDQHRRHDGGSDPVRGAWPVPHPIEARSGSSRSRRGGRPNGSRCSGRSPSPRPRRGTIPSPASGTAAASRTVSTSSSKRASTTRSRTATSTGSSTSTTRTVTGRVIAPCDSSRACARLDPPR